MYWFIQNNCSTTIMFIFLRWKSYTIFNFVKSINKDQSFGVCPLFLKERSTNTKVACTHDYKLVVLYSLITVIIITIINASIIHLPFGTPWPIHRMLEKTYLGENIPRRKRTQWICRYVWVRFLFEKTYPRQIITRM